MARISRVGLIVGGVVLVLASCSSDDGIITTNTLAEPPSETPAETLVGYDDSGARIVLTDNVEASAHDESLPSGLDTYREPTDELPPPTIDLGVLRSGGPGPRRHPFGG